ncbi:MAG TPA: hypothetical protein VFQ38_07755, partial [Longimicrobiales bacterium]|nr:hypothetical protein [Longimicrobiales bacterium]
MTHPLDTAPTLADLAARAESASLPALWAALAPEDRRAALAFALKGNPAFRRQLVELLRQTPRYRAFRPTTFSSWKPEQFADAFKRPGTLPLEAMQVGLIALHVQGRHEML